MSKASNILNYMSHLMQESKYLLGQVTHNLMSYCNKTPENVLCKTRNICDLLYFRENQNYLSFKYDELTSLIEY